MKCAVPRTMLHHGHVKMINDKVRNRFFQQALERTAVDKVVLDVGTGTGLLAAYALQAGARFVYAVERDEKYVEMARTILGSLFDASRFQVIHADFWTSDIDNKIPPGSVDVLVSETVGAALFEESMDLTWHCARPFLKSTAVSIPDRLHMDAVFYDPAVAGIIDVDIIDIGPDRNTYQDLHAENLLFPEFYDQFRHYVTKFECHSWMDPSKVDREPYKIIHDIYTMTKDNIPVMRFEDLPYPQHIQSDIEFQLSVTEPCVVALVCHISSGDQTLTLHKHCWITCPAVQFQESGTYQFRFNPERPVATHNVWLIERV